MRHPPETPATVAIGSRFARRARLPSAKAGLPVLLATVWAATLAVDPGIAGGKPEWSATELLLLLAVLGWAASLLLVGIVLPRRIARHNERVEEALRLSSERLDLAIRSSNVGLWDWRVADGTATFSPRFHELLGYGPGELAARIETFDSLLHPNDAAAAQAAMRAHLHDGTGYEIEFRMRTRCAGYRWFLSRGEAVRTVDGRAIRIAASIADITDRRLSEAASRRHAAQQGLIAQFGQQALANGDIDELLAQAVDVVCEGLDVELCRLLVIGDDDHTLVLKGARGWQPAWATRPRYDAVAETEDRFIIGAREAVLVDDFERESRFRPSEMLIAHGVRSGVEALICGNHGSYAVLGAYSREPARFNPETVDFLRGVTNTLAAAMDRKVADERLTHLAKYDPLTALPNRGVYLDRLWQAIAQAERDRSPVAVLFIDLDRFKIVNDSLGHSAGDEVLVQAAQRLQACVRASDIVCRLGGDEFAIALTGLATPEDAGPVARKIVESLSLPFEVESQKVYVSASIGISSYPEDGADPDRLLKNADTAMYRAKESGRSNHQFYLAQMNDRAVERLQLETDLRGALERGEFLLHYQPKVNLASGAISGFEALLRWQHPQKGLVPPGDFISILEDTGLIIPIGEWVIAEVCAQLNAWQADGLELRPIAVNLSARQFNQKNLDAAIAAIVGAAGVRPDLLEFELTESMLMGDSEASVQTLKNLKLRGFRLSVDDFGTGYSSLGYLKRFPLDSLKIDRTFIRDATSVADDATIAIAIINLARSLKLKVVAEGVETEAQLAFLRQHACDEMQGYLFARPLPAADCTLALRKGWRLPAPTDNVRRIRSA